MADVADFKRLAELFHAHGASIVRQNRKLDARLLQRADPARERLVRLALAFGRERKVEVSEEQLHAMLFQKFRRHGLVIVKHPLRAKKSEHIGLPSRIKVLRLLYAPNALFTRGDFSAHLPRHHAKGAL